MRAPVRTAAQDPPSLKKLVQHHRKIREEPLLLAVQYYPGRNKGDLFLFEIADDFGSNSIDPEKNVFEVTYASTPSFEMEHGQYLHLVLTNPVEFKVAVRENWKAMVELRKAVRAGKVNILFATPEGKSLWNLIS